MSLMYLAFIPFFSIGTLLFYKKHKLYFAEHLIINSYTQVASIAIGLPVMLLHLIIPFEYMGLLGTVSVIV